MSSPGPGELYLRNYSSTRPVTGLLVARHSKSTKIRRRSDTASFVSICSAILRPNALSLSLSLCCASLFTVADKGRYGIFPAISCLPSLLSLYLPTRSHPKKRNRASKPLANFFPASENKTQTAKSSRRWQHCQPLLWHQYFRFRSLTLVTPTKAPSEANGKIQQTTNPRSNESKCLRLTLRFKVHLLGFVILRKSASA